MTTGAASETVRTSEALELYPSVLIGGCVVSEWADQRSSEGRCSPPLPPPVFFFLTLAHVLWGLLRIGQGHVAFIATICCILWGLLPPPLAPLPHTCLALGLRLAGGSRRAGGSFRRAGCFYPNIPDTVQNSITIGFCRTRPLAAAGLAFTTRQSQPLRELNCGNESMPLRITAPDGQGKNTVGVGDWQ